jgi:hypothetical protein
VVQDPARDFSRFWGSLPRPVAVVLVCSIVFSVVGFIFNAKASYETKKSLHPFLTISSGVVFIGLVEWLFPGSQSWFLFAAAAVVLYLNYRNTQFCPQCNATIRPRGFSRRKVCPNCGAPLPD